MAKREASGEATETGGGKAAVKRSRDASPARTPGAADPGAGPRLATGDFPVVEMGGGAAAGALVGRLLGGGKGALLGTAVGAAAGTALGMAIGGVLRRREEDPEAPRQPAFGPRGRSRSGTEAPAAAAQAPSGAAAKSPDRTRARASGSAATQKEPAASTAAKGTAADAVKEPSGTSAGTATKSGSDYESWTKAKLYDEAKRRDIPGRSTMDKADLIRALRSR